MLSSQHRSQSVFFTIRTPSRQSWRGHRIAHSILAWAQDCPKNPSPGQRQRSVSDAVLAASLTECFFHHSQPSRQSWRGHRIAPLNPGVGTGLLHSILAWALDCPGVFQKTLEARRYTAMRSQTRRPACPDWASHQTRLGEPVLIGRARTHWASHQTRLGEPVLRGRWASQYSLGEPVLPLRAVPARRQKCPLGYPAHATSTVACHFHSGPLHLNSGLHATCTAAATFTVAHNACSMRLLGAVPARHIYLLVPARHCACLARLLKCLLGTVPARHIYLQVPAWHCACSAHLPTSARSALCLLGASTY